MDVVIASNIVLNLLESNVDQKLQYRHHDFQFKVWILLRAHATVSIANGLHILQMASFMASATKPSSAKNNLV